VLRVSLAPSKTRSFRPGRGHRRRALEELVAKARELLDNFVADDILVGACRGLGHETIEVGQQGASESGVPSYRSDPDGYVGGDRRHEPLRSLRARPYIESSAMGEAWGPKARIELSKPRATRSLEFRAATPHATDGLLKALRKANTMSLQVHLADCSCGALCKSERQRAKVPKDTLRGLCASTPGT